MVKNPEHIVLSHLNRGGVYWTIFFLCKVSGELHVEKLHFGECKVPGHCPYRWSHSGPQDTEDRRTAWDCFSSRLRPSRSILPPLRYSVLGSTLFQAKRSAGILSAAAVGGSRMCHSITLQLFFFCLKCFLTSMSPVPIQVVGCSVLVGFFHVHLLWG